MRKNKQADNRQLVVLYQRMSDLTGPVCGRDCGKHNVCRCCSPEYCGMAEEIAKEEYGIELQRTGHPTLPFMGEHGCTVAPHLRPICTVHTCDINSLGFKKGDEPWTEQYFKLRAKIDRLEFKRTQDV